MIIGEKWMKWTLIEAIMKISSKVLQKFVGLGVGGIAHILFVSLIMNVIQTAGSLLVSRCHIMAKPYEIAGAILFGCSVFVVNLLLLFTFYHGGDAVVNVFILSLSIVTGALADVIFFKHHLSIRQWIGIAVAVLAGYVILGMPSISELFTLPLWIQLSFATMLLLTLNQIITQKIKDIPPMAKNFWGGSTNLVLTILAMVVLGYYYQIRIDFMQIPTKLWLMSIGLGGIVLVMWSCNVLSYKDGAFISLKKLVLFASYLSIAVIVCPLLFPDEHITLTKVGGIVLFLVAFSLMDEKTWNFIQTKILKRKEVK